MRIVHVSSENSWRGGEQQLIYLHEELLKDKIDSLIICAKYSPVHNYCLEKNLPYVAITFRSPYNIKTVLNYIKAVKRFSPYLIHLHSSKSHTLAIIASFFGLKIPLVLSRRVDFPIKRNKFSKYKYNHPLIKKIICVSDEIKKITSPDIKNKNKLITIYSGVDLRKYTKTKNSNFLRDRYKLKENNILIGNTSALADHKDYFTFVDTAEIISKKQKEVVFFIIGDGPLREDIEEYIELKNLKNIILTGFIIEIIEALSSLDIFLFTSKTEGLGTSVLDALGCGVPVVATKAGGVPEMIESNKNGLLTNIQAPEELAKSIELLIKEEDLRNRFKEEGKKTIQNFSKEKTASETSKIYKELTDAN